MSVTPSADRPMVGATLVMSPETRRPLSAEKTWTSAGSIWMWIVSPFMGGRRASTRSVMSLSPSFERDVCMVPYAKASEPSSSTTTTSNG